MKSSMRNTLLLTVCLTGLLVVSGCATDAEIATETAKYTSEVAQAIAASGWKIAGAVFGGFFIHAILS